MPSGSRARFGAPRSLVYAPRGKAGGLGTEQEDFVPATDDPGRRRDERSTPDQGFTGVRSRSRFTAPVPPVEVGHDGGGEGFRAQGSEAMDPAVGRSLFVRYWPWSLSERNHRQTTSALGRDDIQLAREGRLRYVRRWADVTNPGTKSADLIRTGEGYTPKARMPQRYTLRPEFQQNAQDYAGLHTVVTKRGFASTSPVRMRAPRTYRLTRRSRSGSYGQTTQEMN